MLSTTLLAVLMAGSAGMAAGAAVSGLELAVAAVTTTSSASTTSSAPNMGPNGVFTSPPPASLMYGWGTLATSMSYTANATFEKDAAAPTLTIKVRNAKTVAVSMSYATQVGYPGWVNDPTPAGLAPGATTTLIAPTGWRGSIFVGPNYNPASQIEANLVLSTPNIDVSDVHAYSLPIVCGCGAGTLVAGCNKNLFALNTCGNELAGPICSNPLANSNQPGGSEASPFFQPCQGATISYPNDGGDEQCGD